ncbi:hypothetical protein CYMTET_16322 [Cymbomonas tetramitiformis]|uniref:Uncharacterized protein n=1 Tax=Cymbomonas tetramitiformis TaxID=36881 RepID=A0AAE0L899_9CHLO|nr:hypothetical protein CYMTET_16322 [Cymbomonas tetramitiformis]|eukprot:gene8810-10445_t
MALPGLLEDFNNNLKRSHLQAVRAKKKVFADPDAPISCSWSNEVDWNDIENGPDQPIPRVGTRSIFFATSNVVPRRTRGDFSRMLVSTMSAIGYKLADHIQHKLDAFIKRRASLGKDTAESEFFNAVDSYLSFTDPRKKHAEVAYVEYLGRDRLQLTLTRRVCAGFEETLVSTLKTHLAIAPHTGLPRILHSRRTFDIGSDLLLVCSTGAAREPCPDVSSGSAGAKLSTFFSLVKVSKPKQDEISRLISESQQLLAYGKAAKAGNFSARYKEMKGKYQKVQSQVNALKRKLEGTELELEDFDGTVNSKRTRLAVVSPWGSVPEHPGLGTTLGAAVLPMQIAKGLWTYCNGQIGFGGPTLELMEVAKEWQGRGIGSLFYDAMEKVVLDPYKALAEVKICARVRPPFRGSSSFLCEAKEFKPATPDGGDGSPRGWSSKPHWNQTAPEADEHGISKCSSPGSSTTLELQKQLCLLDDQWLNLMEEDNTAAEALPGHAILRELSRDGIESALLGYNEAHGTCFAGRQVQREHRKGCMGCGGGFCLVEWYYTDLSTDPWSAEKYCSECMARKLGGRFVEAFGDGGSDCASDDVWGAKEDINESEECEMEYEWLF